MDVLNAVVEDSLLLFDDLPYDSCRASMAESVIILTTAALNDRSSYHLDKSRSLETRGILAKKKLVICDAKCNDMTQGYIEGALMLEMCEALNGLEVFRSKYTYAIASSFVQWRFIRKEYAAARIEIYNDTTKLNQFLREDLRCIVEVICGILQNEE